MAKLRKLRETELIGGKSNEDLYPVTVALGVYDQLGHNLQEYLSELLMTYLFGGVVGPSDSPIDNELLNVFYIAAEAGTYVNFDDYVVNNNELCIFMHSTKSGWRIYSINLGSGGGGGTDPYKLPIASDTVLGGIRTGFAQTGKNYPVKVDSSGNAFVYVPWTDTGGGEDPGVVPVTGITLDTYTLEGKIGKMANIFFTIKPENATNKAVLIVSSHPEIAKVLNQTDTFCVIESVAEGDSVITFTTVDGNYTATCNVHVPAAEPVPVESVNITVDSIDMQIGDSEKLIATVSPGNADNKSVTWTSEQDSIASVSSDGTVTAKAEGTTTVTVTTVDGEKTDSCTVRVHVEWPIRDKGYFGVVPDTFEVSEQNIKDTVDEIVLTSRSYTGTVEMDYEKTLYAYPVKFGELTSIKDANGFEYLQSYTKSQIQMNGMNYYVYVLTDASIIPSFKQIFS